MSDVYNRNGERIDMMEWARQIEADPALRRVAETLLPDGKWISTVWLGLDHSFGSGPPLIFETMVFSSKDDMSDLDCHRYTTEAEALAGHAAMVEKWSQAEVVR